MTLAKIKVGTVADIMSSRVPTCRPEDDFSQIVNTITTGSWDSIGTVYVTDNRGVLLGCIDVAGMSQSDPKARAKTLMRPARASLHANDGQSAAVFLAVRQDVISIPVLDKAGRLLGTITARKIIDIMHREHIEDTLTTVGVHGYTDIIKLVSTRVQLIVRSRAPWLVIGLVVGLGLGLISSLFEKALQENVAIAYFIPVVAYIADSVGTQSEAIAVRALAMVKVDPVKYLFKETLVGLMLGGIMGLLGGIGAWLISQTAAIGVVVGLSLFIASTLASVLASLLPIIFKAKGKDPALGSGPLSTALQDVLSVVIYFLFAVVIMR